MNSIRVSLAIMTISVFSSTACSTTEWTPVLDVDANDVPDEDTSVDTVTDTPADAPDGDGAGDPDADTIEDPPLCEPGYEWDGSECVDVDECTVTPTICGSGTCINEEGGYTCECEDGDDPRKTGISREQE